MLYVKPRMATNAGSNCVDLYHLRGDTLDTTYKIDEKLSRISRSRLGKIENGGRENAPMKTTP
jgi:hypothetical protein